MMVSRIQDFVSKASICASGLVLMALVASSPSSAYSVIGVPVGNQEVVCTQEPDSKGRGLVLTCKAPNGKVVGVFLAPNKGRLTVISQQGNLGKQVEKQLREWRGESN